MAKKHYKKIFLYALRFFFQVPGEHVVGNFFVIVDKFLESSEEGQVLGIHCTHGLNRSFSSMPHQSKI